MREITTLMIKKYDIMKLRRDFAGYIVTNKNQLSFHHLLIPKRLSKQEGIGDGYLEWNGAILRQLTSHDYLHFVETRDRDIFLYITDQMEEENEKGYLDPQNWDKIDSALTSFEREHCGERSKKGNLLIKESYIRDRRR